MKSLIQKMLVSTAIAIVLLGSAGNAMGAPAHHKANLHHRASASATRAPRSGAGYNIAARVPYRPWTGGPLWAPGYPLAGPNIDIRQLLAALANSGVPIHYRGRAVRSGGSHQAAPSYDPGPSPDSSPPSDPSPAGPDTAGMNTSTNPTWPALDQ